MPMIRFVDAAGTEYAVEAEEGVSAMDAAQVLSAQAMRMPSARTRREKARNACPRRSTVP